MNSLFIFRLDLRLKDNTGLIECIKNSDNVYLTFIFEPKQIDKKKNNYFSSNCVQFMIESLKELYTKTDKKLIFFYGNTIEVIESVIKKLNINNIYFNKDYTPFSLKRDSNIKTLCEKLGCGYNDFNDILLNDINTPMKDNGEPYSTFSSYHSKALGIEVDEPDNYSNKLKFKKANNLKHQIKMKDLDNFYDHNEHINVNGGRKLALKILKGIKNQKKYNKLRGLCDYKSTHLSAYIKFGCVSIREVYHTFRNELGSNNDLVKQLYWRDFYYNLIYHFPHTYNKKTGLKDIYEDFPWEHNKGKFKKWCQGETGFPIIDASMKNLNKTGYMPNRSRLIVANFLTKILRIDWTWGEEYFAQQLVDYSVSNNLGNWQWVASIGADYQNRIYNPMSQSEKSDPECQYIKKWLPVLNDIPNKDIHNWFTKNEKYNLEYHKPMVNYTEEYKKSRELFKKYA